MVGHAEELVGCDARVDEGPQRGALQRRPAAKPLAGRVLELGKGPIGGFELARLAKSKTEVEQNRRSPLRLVVRQRGRAPEQRDRRREVLPPQRAAPGQGEQAAGAARELSQALA